MPVYNALFLHLVKYKNQVLIFKRLTRTNRNCNAEDLSPDKMPTTMDRRYIFDKIVKYDRPPHQLPADTVILEMYPD